MSLSNSTQQLLRSQYYDDYYATSNTDPSKTQGEVNDFHRILFRPKYPIQSRELTQLQTTLQAQLERLGKAQFRDGEAVLGGQLSLDTSVTSGMVLPTTNLVALFDRTENAGKYVFDTTDETVKAHVLQFVSADEGSTTNNYVVFKPQTSTSFLPGTVVQAADDATITATFASGVAADVFQKASIISIDEGVFFVSGFFVRVAPQTIVLNPFSALPSYRVGLTIQEQVLDELDDVVGASLLDPANNNAPGAHRFRVKLTLDKKPLTSDADAGFIELARVVNGEVLNARQTPKYVRLDELNQILARRTFDEAGDYLVHPFTGVIDTNPDDPETFILSLGPGKGYVRGYEVTTKEPTDKVIRKGRETQTANNRSIPVPVGNFVYATRVAATVPSRYFANTATVDIHCVKIGDIDPSSNTTYTYSRIGQCKVRMIETFQVPVTPSEFANNSVRKLFFYDVVGDSITGNVTSASVNNVTAITAVVPIANGTPHVNGAVEGATIVLGGASSPVSGTFTVNNYSYANADHAFVTFREFLPTLPNGNTTYKLIFQMKDVDSFAVYDANVSSMDAPYFPDFAFQADVHTDSKVGGIPGANTLVSDSNDNTLLYQIPEKFVTQNTITANSAVWKSWVKSGSNAQTFAAVSNVDFTLVVSGNNFSLPTGSLDATVAEEFLTIFDQTNDVHGHGRIINAFDGPAATDKCISNVVVTASGSDYNIEFTYHFGGATSTTRSLIALAKATVSGLPVRTKTLVVGNTTAVMTGTNLALNSGQIEYFSLNASAGFAYSMKTTDVFRIKQILYKDANTAFANSDLSTATDVTDLFSLDNGQRDNSYEYSQIIAGSRASSVVRPTGRLLVIFDWFKNSGRGYATVDSYLSSLNLTNGMTYDIIPDYKSVKFSTSINLRSVLDFRPVRSNFEFANTALQYAASDNTVNNTYLTSTSESYLIPVSDDVWFASYQFYLSRIDKIGVAFDGSFKVIEGTDAVSPQAPVDDTGALLLYQLNIPAYTLVDANGVPTGVTLKTFDHKRFTMQDLSKMDDRVSHLEFYAALNSLETITKNTPVLDSDQNERFKNGIVVDTFHGGETADLPRPDFTASLDVKEGELHVAYRTFAVQFAPDLANGTSFGITLVGDMAIPSYNVIPFITQALASHAISVNPFDVASFYGDIRLSPAVDTWKDVNTLPAQVVDMGGMTQSWIDANQPSFTNWGEWDQTWSGVTASEPKQQFFTPPGWTPEDHAPLSATELTYNDVTTSTQYQQQGTAFEFYVQTTTQSLGNRVVDTSIVHNMRGRDVVFGASGMKPQANLYAYFDGTQVMPFIQQATVLRLDSITGTMPFYQGQTVYVKKAVTGNVAVSSGTPGITGSGTFFNFEMVPGALVRIVQGVNTFDGTVISITSNTSATLAVNSAITLANATLYTLTPVTIADIAPRITGNTTQYTVKVVRAVRDADTDQAVPYPIVAGALRPEKLAKDAANTTFGATLLIPASARAASNTMNIAGAMCYSGVVRDWNSGTASVRFDTDITDSLVSTPGTRLFFPSGPGAGQSANIVSYNAAIQTAVVDTASLSLVPGKTIYSVGIPKSDGFVANNAVTSGRAGTAAGVFHLPGGTFGVGTRLFRLTDDPDNTGNDATTVAETNYVASGISYTQQDTSITTRNLMLRNAGPRTQSFTVQDHSTNGFNVQYVDPLAETFLVDSKLFPQGVFVSSIDLCFATKPTDDIPVTLEVRPVVNGYPSSNEVVPCVGGSGMAAVILRPDQVNVSASPSFDDAQTVTTFTLPAPVHLMPGQEYSIVVRSDSDLYTVYTAELGAAIIGSDAKIAKQPYAGSFFKSQNASTWTESPFEDLMFRINRATWTGSADAPQTGTLIARGVAPDANTTLDSYEFYPHEVQFAGYTSSDYSLDIKPLNESTGDLTGEVAVRYPVIPNIWSLLQSRSMLQGYGGSAAANNAGGRPSPFIGPTIPASNTVDALMTLTTISADVAPYVDLKKVNMLGVRHLINDMVLDSDEIVLIDPGAGYLANLQAGLITTSSGNNIVTGDGNTDFTLSVGPGDTVVVGGNLSIIVQSVTNTSQFVATANVSVSRAANDFWTFGALNGNNTSNVAISGGNGTGAAGYLTVGRDGTITGLVITDEGTGYTGTPTLTAVAPDVPGGDYTLTQNTAVFGYNSELGTTGGNALTRYITRPVTLASGFEAADIKVTFDAYRPLGSNFYVYYKVLPGDADTARFEDQPWRLMDMETPDSTVSTSYFQYKQFDFVTPNTRALDATSDTSDKFKVFAIKIVVASNDTVDVPRIANFRAIALDE